MDDQEYERFMALTPEERKMELERLEKEMQDLTEWPPIDENKVLDI